MSVGAKTRNGNTRREVFVCCSAAEFPAQALLRLRPALAREAIAVLDGSAEQRVCAANRRARRTGVRDGMTGPEVAALGVVALPRSKDLERMGRAAMLATAMHASAEVEACSTDMAALCIFRLTDAPAENAELRALAVQWRGVQCRCGFRVSVAVSANFHTARMLAYARRGITLVQPGMEQRLLSPLLLHALPEMLPMDEKQRRALAASGVRSLGALAMLSHGQLTECLGQAGIALRELARGEHPHRFAPASTSADPAAASRLEAVLARLSEVVGTPATADDGTLP